MADSASMGDSMGDSMVDSASEQGRELLVLPAFMLHEIHSWSPTSLYAAALRSTCHSLQQLRHDPAAAAHLLLRCPSQDYEAALPSYSQDPASSSALVQNLVALLRAGPGGDAVHTAPEPLLSAMLLWAVSEGEVATVQALLALPVPPDLEVHGSLAVETAVGSGPHLSMLPMLQALLEGGARPWATPELQAFASASAEPESLAALQLLLHSCPEAHLPAAKVKALHSAAMFGNAAAASVLLPATYATDADIRKAYMFSVPVDHVAVLGMLLDHHPVSSEVMGHHLSRAAGCVQPLCSALLLDRGADVNYGEGMPLFDAIRNTFCKSDEARVEVVALLLRHGAVVTPRMLKKAKEIGRAAVLDLLQEAITGVGA